MGVKILIGVTPPAPLFPHSGGSAGAETQEGVECFPLLNKEGVKGELFISELLFDVSR